MSAKPWFELRPEDRDKCENCGLDITGRLIERDGHKYCSQACAKAKGPYYIPEEDKYVVLSTSCVLVHK